MNSEMADRGCELNTYITEMAFYLLDIPFFPMKRSSSNLFITVIDLSLEKA